VEWAVAAGRDCPGCRLQLNLKCQPQGASESESPISDDSEELGSRVGTASRTSIAMARCAHRPGLGPVLSMAACALSRRPAGHRDRDRLAAAGQAQPPAGVGAAEARAKPCHQLAR
jgi:hypothetical protein